MRASIAGCVGQTRRITSPSAPANGTITLAPVDGFPDRYTFSISALPFDGGAPILRIRYQIVLRGGGGWTGAYDVTGGVVPVAGDTYTVTLPAAQASKVGKSCDLRFWCVNSLSQSGGNVSEVVQVDLVPTLSSASDVATGQSTATYSVSTTGSMGTLYATRAASAPANGAAVKAASQVTGFPLTITASGTQTVNLSGLSASTAYDAVHFAHETATGKLSAVSSADGFTTSSAPDTTNPTLLNFTSAVDPETYAITATLIFSEAVSFNTGNIVLRENNGGWADLATYNTASPPAQISISGDTLTITPVAAATADRQYAIRIAGTCIQDGVGNLYAGVADDTTLAFTAPSSADATITYTPGTGMQVYRAFDAMVEGGWTRPQDETLSSQIFTISGSPSGVSSNNGYLLIDTSAVVDDTFDYTVSWSDSVTDPGGGSFTWRVRRNVAYPTTMRIGHATPVNTPTRGRAVAPTGTTISSQTLSGSPVTLFAITDSGGHARLHYRTGESAPTPGAVYVVTLSNAAVVTVTIDQGTTVATLAEANTAYVAAAGGDIIYLREGRQTGNAPETINGVGSSQSFGRATDTANGLHVVLTSHSDDSPPVVGKITMGGASAVQRAHFKRWTFEANMSGNSQGATNVFLTNAKSEVIIEDCTFHGQRRTNGAEAISTTSNTNLRTYMSIAGANFTLRGCRIYDAREAITIAGGTGCTIEDNIIRRIVFDFIGTSRCEGLTVTGNRMADPLFSFVDMPLVAAPVAGPTIGGYPTIVFSVADASEISGIGNAEDKAWAWGCRTASSDAYSYTPPSFMVAVDYASSPNTITVSYESAGTQTARTNLLANYTSGGILRAAKSRLHGDFFQLGKPTPAPSAYSAATTYTLGQHVTYNSRYYTCAVASSTGSTPSSYVDWADADFQSNITIEGNAFVRGTGIPGRTSGQGIYSARSEVPKVDWLVRGNLVNSLTDKGIWLQRMQGGQVVSNTSITPLGTAATQFTTDCALTVAAETGYTVDVYDNVASGTIALTNAVGTSTNYAVPSIAQQFTWPEDAADVSMYDALFVDVPVREQTITEAGFYDMFVGQPGNANMFPSGQPDRGWQGEFDPSTGTYSGPR